MRQTNGKAIRRMVVFTYAGETIQDGLSVVNIIHRPGAEHGENLIRYNKDGSWRLTDPVTRRAHEALAEAMGDCCLLVVFQHWPDEPAP